ncbi:MAG: acyltransferase [Candidatus Aenigmatarchaeota archaeon]
MRQLVVHKCEGNSLLMWNNIRNPLRVTLNIFITEIAKYMPLGLKRSMYRAIGIKIGKDVAIGYKAQFDILFPELIEIGENTIIGYGATLLAHEFLTDEWRTGKIKIGKNVMIGANTTVLSGVSIGDNTVVSAMSLVNRDIPANVFAGGIPVRILKRK